MKIPAIVCVMGAMACLLCNAQVDLEKLKVEVGKSALQAGVAFEKPQGGAIAGGGFPLSMYLNGEGYGITTIEVVEKTEETKAKTVWEIYTLKLKAKTSQGDAEATAHIAARQLKDGRITSHNVEPYFWSITPGTKIISRSQIENEATKHAESVGHSMEILNSPLTNKHVGENLVIEVRGVYPLSLSYGERSSQFSPGPMTRQTFAKFVDGVTGYSERKRTSGPAKVQLAGYETLGVWLVTQADGKPALDLVNGSASGESGEHIVLDDNTAERFVTTMKEIRDVAEKKWSELLQQSTATTEKMHLNAGEKIEAAAK